MGLAPSGETIVLNALLTSRHVALFVGNPEAGGTEVSGGAYARQPYVYSITGSNPAQAANTAVIQFPVATASWGALTHFAIYSAATGGTLLAAGALTQSKTIDADDVARFPIGTLRVTAD